MSSIDDIRQSMSNKIVKDIDQSIISSLIGQHNILSNNSLTTNSMFNTTTTTCTNPIPNWNPSKIKKNKKDIVTVRITSNEILLMSSQTSLEDSLNDGYMVINSIKDGILIFTRFNINNDIHVHGYQYFKKYFHILYRCLNDDERPHDFNDILNSFKKYNINDIKGDIYIYSKEDFIKFLKKDENMYLAWIACQMEK